MKDSKFDFSAVLRVIWKHIWLVIVFAVIGAGVTLVLRPKGTVTHTATAQVMITPKKNYDVSNGTLMDMVKTYDVLGVAIKQYNRTVELKKDKASYNDLSEDLQVSINGNSRIVTIKAEEDSVVDAKKLVNLIAKRTVMMASEKLPTFKNSIVTSARVSGQTSGGLDAKKAIVIGGAVGLIVGIEGTILLDRYQNRGKKKRI